MTGQISKTKVLLIALCLGVVTAGMVYMFLAGQARVARSEIAVVTAKRMIPINTVIDLDMLEIRSIPKNVLPPKTALNPNIVVGQVASKEFRPGEPVSILNLGPKDRLSYIVPPLMRAVTVAIDPVTGVGGFIKAGDHVDVIVTFQVNEGTLTKTVLQNVELLATGGQTSVNNNKNGESQAKSTDQPNATLAVRPLDAEKLVLADSKGKIRLALRRGDDPSFISTKGVTGRAVMGIVPPDAPEEKDETQVAQQAGPPPDMKEWLSMMGKAMPQSQPQTASKPSKKYTAEVPTKPTALPVEKVVEKVQIIRGTESEEVTFGN